MNEGDIFFGRKYSDACHPIVYLRDKDENFFIGAMLTTSENFKKDNILMAEEHFKKEHSKDIKSEVFFKNTHLVKIELIKKIERGPFKKVGELTNKGIKFVKSNVKDKGLMFWEKHLGAKKQTNEI